MKIDALDHPKTIDLAANLGICMPQAIGHLELLWVFVGQKTPRGNIGRWSNAVIAHHAQWTGNPDDFVAALIAAGFVDEDDEYRLLIHDWEDHMPRWVKAKLSTQNEEVIRRGCINVCSYDDSTDDSQGDSTDCSQDCSADSVSEVKGSVRKRKTTTPTAARFGEFWDEYPKKVGKKKCRAKWKSRKLDRIADTLIADVRRRKAEDVKWLEGFVPNPETYINGDRWEDELQPREKGNSGPKWFECEEGITNFARSRGIEANGAGIAGLIDMLIDDMRSHEHKVPDGLVDYRNQLSA